MTRNQLTYWANEETARANRARELETNRSNVVNERETRRSNLAKEQETKRSNIVNEGIKRDTLSETTRHNRVSEVTEGVKAAGAVMRGVGSII